MKKRAHLDRLLQSYAHSASALRAVRRGLNNRGIRYSAAAAAGAALVGAGSAEAALITSPNQGFTLNTTSGVTIGALDIDGDGNFDLGIFMTGYFSIWTSGSFGSSFPGSGTAFNSVSLIGYLGLARRSVSLAAFDLSASTYFYDYRSQLFTFPPYSPPANSLTSTRTRTLAFSFTAGTNTAALPNMGWLQAMIRFGPGRSQISFPTIVYNTTPGAPIHVGDAPNAVPEPSSVALMGLGLLALGGRGVREMRRRKKQANTES